MDGWLDGASEREVSLFWLWGTGKSEQGEKYTQYELYGTGYMGHIFGLVENSEKIRDRTSL